MSTTDYYNSLFVKAKECFIDKDILNEAVISDLQYLNTLYNNCKPLFDTLVKEENLVVAEKALKYLINKNIIVNFNINTIDTNRIFQSRDLLPVRFLQHNFLTVQTAILSSISCNSLFPNLWNTLTVIYQQMLSTTKNYGAHISWREDKIELFKSMLASFFMSLGLYNSTIIFPDKDFFYKNREPLFGIMPDLESYYDLLALVNDVYKNILWKSKIKLPKIMYVTLGSSALKQAIEDYLVTQVGGLRTYIHGQLSPLSINNSGFSQELLNTIHDIMKIKLKKSTVTADYMKDIEIIKNKYSTSIVPADDLSSSLIENIQDAQINYLNLSSDYLLPIKSQCLISNTEVSKGCSDLWDYNNNLSDFYNIAQLANKHINHKNGVCNVQFLHIPLDTIESCKEILDKENEALAYKYVGQTFSYHLTSD